MFRKLDETEINYRHKPRIVDFIEGFEQQYAQEITGDFLTDIACVDLVLYLFGPLESDEELNLYVSVIMRRVEMYRANTH
jgi:hypothetical protein